MKKKAIITSYHFLQVAGVEAYSVDEGDIIVKVLIPQLLLNMECYARSDYVRRASDFIRRRLGDDVEIEVLRFGQDRTIQV